MNGELNINGQIIVFSEYKYNNKQYNIELFLNSVEFSDFIKSLDKKYIIVIGGDGTMLSSIHKYNELDLPFIGINFGNKGFLLQDKNIILEKNKYIIKEYSLFDIYVDGIKQSTFINEVNVTALNGKMGEFEIGLGNKDKLEMKGDGFIIATPLGSTAYNNSLGGPTLSHCSKSIVFTAKAPWKPKNLPSIVLDENETIIIKNIGRHHGLQIFGDSIKIEEKCDTVEIKIQKSDHILKFAIAENYKLKWENKIFDF